MKNMVYVISLDDVKIYARSVDGHDLILATVSLTCILIITADQKAKMIQKAKRASNRNSGKKNQ